MHRPVLLQQAIENLNIKPDGLYIDATFGEGGHTQEILKRGGRVLGIDIDVNQVQNSKFKTQNLKLVHGNFKEIEKIAKENNFYPADGILIDLGLSMKQVNGSGRGFSYKNLNDTLDMRINLDQEKTAADIVNRLSEENLYDILASYSEDINSKEIAKEIVFSRKHQRIQNVKDILAIIDNVIGQKDEKTYRRVFQALRIATNDEFENLNCGLAGAVATLKKGGRLVVITFHSLEDRIVKNFVRKNNFFFVNKKVIKAGSGFHFERSAKMRVIEK